MQTIDTKIHALLQMALDCKEYNVHVGYAPHVDSVSISVYPGDTDYNGEQLPEYDWYVYLDRDDTDEKLDAMLAYVEGLG